MYEPQPGPTRKTKGPRLPSTSPFPFPDCRPPATFLVPQVAHLKLLSFPLEKLGGGGFQRSLNGPFSQLPLSQLSPQPLTFSPLDDPFHQQPQQCHQDEGQGGGDQDVKSLAFQPRQGVLVEGSEEKRRGRGKEEVWEGGRFKAAFPNSQLFGKWPLSLKKPSPHPTLKEPCLWSHETWI